MDTPWTASLHQQKPNTAVELRRKFLAYELQIESNSAECNEVWMILVNEKKNFIKNRNFRFIIANNYNNYKTNLRTLEWLNMLLYSAANVL